MTRCTTLRSRRALSLRKRLAGDYLRRHYATPLAASDLHVPVAAWSMGTWWTRNGKFAFAPWPPESLLVQICPPDSVGGKGGKGGPGGGPLMQCIAQHGYTEWTSYQPASRFWSFQWIEGGWLLALTALLIAATIWLVRHRAA